MKKILLSSLILGSLMSLDAQNNESALPEVVTAQMNSNPIKVRYTNYRGETAVRTIIPIKFLFGSNEYHKDEQWLIELYDVERKAMRVYALKEITQWFVE